MFLYIFYHRISNWLKAGIQRKLVFWSIGFWIISVSVLSVTFLWTGQSEITSEIRNRNVQTASIISRDINSRVSGIISDTRLFSHHLESLGTDMESQASALLTLRLSSSQRYHAVYYLNENYKLLFHLTDPLADLLTVTDITEITDRPSVSVDVEVLATAQLATDKEIYISDIHFHGLDLLPVMCISFPLEFPDTETRYVVFQIDIRDIWQRINLSTVGQSGFTYAVSESGRTIVHPDMSIIGNELPEKLEQVQEGYEGFVEYEDTVNNKTVFAAYSPVGSPVNWTIIVQQDKFEANAPIVRTTIIVVIVWASLATIGTVGILIMTQTFTRPILELTGTTREIERTGKLIKTSLEKNPDEIGQLSLSFDRMIDRLQNMEGRLATVAAEERNRLARDLHDAVSQTLFSASLIADVLPSLWEKDPKKGRERLEEIRLLTRGALAEMRTLLIELRPSALIEAELPHLLTQLSEAINGRIRIPVTVSTIGDCAPSDDVKVALYRIAQEALNNVAKHSGADNVKVVLDCNPDSITLKIIDNGKGFDADKISSESLGIGIMRERAEDVGASLSVISRPGHGTEITAAWKISSQEEGNG